MPYADPEKARAARRAWKKRNAAKVLADTRNLKRRQKDRLAWSPRPARCELCGRSNYCDRALVLDHDHRCCPGPAGCALCVRGWLCGDCNRALGLLKDDADLLRRMADYLEARSPMITENWTATGWGFCA